MEKHMVFLSHSSKDAEVTQLICHRLEENGIPCWMAPRDIKHADWADAIMDGLRRSDICVIVVSEHSIESGEVAKEITQATGLCSYIIPFKLDLAELNDRMRYHLGPCHWLDASTPPIEKKVQDLLMRIQNLTDEDKVYMNSRKMRLVEKISWPKTTFVGRDDEIATIARKLPDTHVLFLQGMGGIGKSEIAKSYAKQYRDRYDTILFLTYEGSIRHLITGDDLMIENLAPQDTNSETTEQFFHRKMEAFRKLASERTLLILDNYDVDDDPDFNDLVNCACHLLVTTRNEHEDYEALKIEAISDFNQVRKIFNTAYGKEPKTEEQTIIDEIIVMVGCHTITVELIARQMKASRKKPQEMLTLLKSTGINTGLREKVKREGETEAGNAFSFIKKLFNVSSLGEECCKLLVFMTLVPIAGTDISLFYDICDLESYDEINELIAHNWLRLDEDTDILSMHSIIADVVRDELSVTEEKCADYITKLAKKLGTLWFASREERAEKWPLYGKVLSVYPNPIPSLWEAYIKMANAAWVCGKYDLSIRTGMKTLELVQREFPEDRFKIGSVAMNVGGCYHNSGDDISAGPYYELGLECQKEAISEESPATAWRELAIAYQKVGRCAYLRGEYEKSRSCLESSEQIALAHPNEILELGDTYTELCRLKIAEEKFEEALCYAEKSREYYEKKFGTDSPNHAYSYTDFGRCYTALGRFAEAQEALEHALAINIRYHGEDNRQTYWNREALGRLELAKGDKEAARRIFTELYLRMEQSFGENNPSVKELAELAH